MIQEDDHIKLKLMTVVFFSFPAQVMDAQPLALAVQLQLPKQRKQELEQEVSFFKIVFGLLTHRKLRCQQSIMQ